MNYSGYIYSSFGLKGDAINILVIQNGMLGSIGVLGEALIQQGARLTTWLAKQQPHPPEGDYSGLIILGGVMNAHEDDKFPHLKIAVELIQQFHGEGKPIIGVCLGAQLIARAFGSTVYPHTTPELGFSPIQVIHSTHREPWLHNCPDDLRMMQWHFDTFDLPHQAELLMTNDHCPHQAYRIGSNIYGFQFHLEATPAIVSSWLTDQEEWIAAHSPHLDQHIQGQLKTYAEQSARFARSVAQWWMDLFPTPIQ